MISPAEAYGKSRTRFLTVLAGVDVERPVPACPGWRVRDVAAHVTGIAVEMTAGRRPGPNVDEWSAAQVEARRGIGFADVLGEWDSVLAAFTTAMEGPLAAAAPRFATDLVSHTFDVAAAAGATIERDTPEAELALATFVGMLGERLDRAGLASLRIVADDRELRAGSSEPAGAEVRVSAYEALRGLSGRRTASEIRSYQWDGPADPFLDVFAAFPFPERSLGE